MNGNTMEKRKSGRCPITMSSLGQGPKCVNPAWCMSTLPTVV